MRKPLRLLAVTTAACVPGLILGGCVLTVTPESATEAEPVSAPSSPPATDIWLAAGDGDIQTLEAHKRVGTDLDILQADIGITPLMVTIVADQLEAARWLIANGANANAVMRDGGNALHGAAFVGNAAGAKLLLESGVDTEALNNDGLSVWDILALDWPTTEYIGQMLELDLVEAEVETGRAAIAELLETEANDAGAATGAGDAGGLFATAISGGVATTLRRR